jgi:hypothetical protein
MSETKDFDHWWNRAGECGLSEKLHWMMREFKAEKHKYSKEFVDEFREVCIARQRLIKRFEKELYERIEKECKP